VIPYVVTNRQLEIAEIFWGLPPGGGLTLDGPAVQEALDWYFGERTDGRDVAQTDALRRW